MSTETKKIQIYLWNKVSKLELKHDIKYDYSIEKRNEIVQKVIESGNNVMICDKENYCIIYIDSGKFSQR